MAKTPRETLALIVYWVLGISLMPLWVSHLLWRGLKQPAYWAGWSERFLGLGLTAFSVREQRFFEGEDTTRRPRIMWLHAVSVGETRAAAPFIERWLRADASHRVVLTHTTPTGRQTGAELFSAQPRVIQRYLPYDYPWANAFFLSWARPDLGILMETEIWPGLIAQAAGRGIPMVLVNARLSPRSARRLQAFRVLSRPALAALAGIAAQTQQDADGFLRVLGTGHAGAGQMDSESSAALPMARPSVVVTGNMKFDVSVPVDQIEQAAVWRQSWPHHQVWIAASTRDDEEVALLREWALARQNGELAQALLVIVPRHPQRFDRVAKLIENQGLAYQRRSQGLSAGQALDPDTAVLLADSMGEMFAYLSASDLVLMGGSLPALGGQNPIEACAVGRPVFYGPHMHNFQQIAHDLQSVGAGEEVLSPRDWLSKGQALLADPSAWARRSQSARSYAQAHRGAADRTLTLLLTLITAR